MEDVTDIILNLKQVRFKQHSPDTVTLKISKQGAGKVTAADIQITDKVEVLNPEQHIATIGGNGSREITVSFGRGYVPAEELPQLNAGVGVIPVDAIFLPSAA